MELISAKMLAWIVGGGFVLLVVGALFGFLAAALCRAAACGDCAIEQQRNAEPVEVDK
jgi:hypothetical protein